MRFDPKTETVTDVPDDYQIDPKSVMQPLIVPDPYAPLYSPYASLDEEIKDEAIDSIKFLVDTESIKFFSNKYVQLTIPFIPNP